MQPLGLAMIASGVLSASVATYAVAVAPLRHDERLGSRGLRRTRALAEGGWFALLEPLLRWAGTRLSGLLPGFAVRGLEDRLIRAGDYLGLTAEEYVVMILASSGAASLGSYALARSQGLPVAIVILGAFLGAYLADEVIESRIRTRLREITHGLPYVVDLLSLGMTAGLDFPGAVKSVVERSSDKTDALIEELERVLQELALGHTRKHALEQLAQRTKVPAAIEFSNAVIQAETRGAPIVDVLSIQAQVLRDKRSAAAEVSTARAQEIMQLPLVMLGAALFLVLIVPSLLSLLPQVKWLLK
jgi:tight adherence protein C